MSIDTTIPQPTEVQLTLPITRKMYDWFFNAGDATICAIIARCHAAETALDAERAAAGVYRAALEMVVRRWTFDNYQQHTHSWHDLQDCLDVIRPIIAAVERKASDNGPK